MVVAGRHIHWRTWEEKGVKPRLSALIVPLMHVVENTKSTQRR